MPSLDSSIKQAQEFMQLWVKYHSIYTGAIGKKAADSRDEELFLDTRKLLNRRYASLKETLNLTDNLAGGRGEAVRRLLDLPGILALSDSRIVQLENDWKESFLLLNGLLADLQKERSQRPRSGMVKTIINKVLKT